MTRRFALVWLAALAACSAAVVAANRAGVSKDAIGTVIVVAALAAVVAVVARHLWVTRCLHGCGRRCGMWCPVAAALCARPDRDEDR